MRLAANDRLDRFSPLSAMPPLGPRVSPTQRQRLQTYYERGRRLSTDVKNPNYDEAHALFAVCVGGDPGNHVYVEALLENLDRKYHGSKKGKWLAVFSVARAALKRAAAREDWRKVLSLGPAVLRSNPWDVSILRSLAQACAAHHFHEAELRYLKNALDAYPQDPALNRHCAEAFAKLGQFEHAIDCWRQAEEFGTASDKEEAAKRIAEHTVERASNYQDRSAEHITTPKTLACSRTSNNISGDIGRSSIVEDGEARRKRNDERRQSLEKALTEDPTDAAGYVRLADLLVDEEKFDQAERLLQQGLAAAGQHLSLLERLEDLQVERAARRVAVAEQRAVVQNTAEAWRLTTELKYELNRIELEYYRRRVDRYPHDGGLLFEFGLRLKVAKNWEEAADCFRKLVEKDPKPAAALVELGETLQYLRRFPEAMLCYERAIKESGDEDRQMGNRALYRAGVLATGLNRLEQAEAYFQELLGRDPHNKDVSGSALV